MVDVVGHFSERSSRCSMSERSKCCVFLLASPLLQDSLSPSTVSSPSCFVSQIIGAEDDYFGSDQEQVGPKYIQNKGKHITYLVLIYLLLIENFFFFFYILYRNSGACKGMSQKNLVVKG